MNGFFKISERGSSVSDEVVGGITTFLAMAYIIAVNPDLMEAAGIPFEAALTSTCLGAAIMTIAMGLIANRPIALASGMGINAIVAYTLCLGEIGVDWRVAMAVIFLEGIVILVLVLCGLRKAIMDAIPVDLRRAIGIGIGLFIAFIGLKGGGLIAADESTILTLGEVSSPTCIVALVSILVAVVLQVLKVKGGLVISIIAATVIGIPLGVTLLPTEWNFGLDFSAFAAPFQTDPATGTIAVIQVFMQPILLVDSAAAAAGGFLGASSITSFVESASGAAAGARTGLSNVVVGVLFALCAFFAPIIGMVSSAATCGALVVVGYLMLVDVAEIDWKRIEHAMPAFFTIVGIPMTYSITNGIGLGFISYCVIMLVQGRGRDVHPLMWVAALAFLVMFVIA